MRGHGVVVKEVNTVVWHTTEEGSLPSDSTRRRVVATVRWIAHCFCGKWRPRPFESEAAKGHSCLGHNENMGI